MFVLRSLAGLCTSRSWPVTHIPSAFTTIVPITPLWLWILFKVSSTSAWKRPGREENTGVLVVTPTLRKDTYFPMSRPEALRAVTGCLKDALKTAINSFTTPLPTALVNLFLEAPLVTEHWLSQNLLPFSRKHDIAKESLSDGPANVYRTWHPSVQKLPFRETLFSWMIT